MSSISLQTATCDFSLGTASVDTLNSLYRVRTTGLLETSSRSLPAFIPSATTLVAAGISPPDRESLDFLQRPLSGAQATAVKNFCDSISTGLFSEASNGEFIDVGRWLGSGHYQKGQESAVLTSLEEWMQSTRTRITTREFEMSTECNAGFSTAYQNLKDAHCFCVSSGGVTAACFLLGEIHQQWCGLVSIAIISD